MHSVETYGLNIKIKGENKTKVSFLVDTLYFDGLVVWKMRKRFMIYITIN
ncbi:hypothetical protein C5S32_11195 [ANME-1 cluster archaeon GoMg1]|nr:hypothetical protein [ANME-1 cluster archaeon GoMg1]